MMNDCDNCRFEKLTVDDYPCDICSPSFSEWKPVNESISFFILNNLTPTLESCTKKVFEEIGELMQLLGKGQGESGESTVERLNNQSKWVRRTAEEALDGAQSLVTLFCVLLDEPNDREIALQGHIKKLRKKEYLK
jgi:hypothetical protein